MVSSKKVSIFGFAIVLLGPPKVTFIKPFSPSLIFLGLLYYGEDRGRRIFTSKLRDFFLPRTMSNVSWKVLPTVRDRPPKGIRTTEWNILLLTGAVSERH